MAHMMDHPKIPEKLDNKFENNDVQMITEQTTTTKQAETQQERTSRLKREELEAKMSHIFKGVAVFVYVSMIGLCAYYINDPKLGDFAQRTIVPMVAALAAFAVGRSIK